MRALQELIPRCNKVVYDLFFEVCFVLFFFFPAIVDDCLRMVLTCVIFVFSKFQSDKASMLDEAIEYLKSLQLQVHVCHSYLFFFPQI
jgi:hypothetical protein